MNRTFVALGAFLGMLAIALGAFGTHSLRDRLPEDLLTVWQTAVQYHLAHAILLVIVGAIAGQLQPKWARAAGWLLLFGILIFGGTLYVLAATGIRWLGAITPLGGLSFILGWLCLGVAAVHAPSSRSA